MDETTAWLYQARADWLAAERLVVGEGEIGPCHAIAKWQHTVEKAVKALVSALHSAGILRTGVIAKHDVERYVGVLIRLPRSGGNRTLQQHLHGLLSQDTRKKIKELDDLVPQKSLRRNTEYPFQQEGQWTYPAAEGVFSQTEVQQFRSLAHHLLNGAQRLVSMIRRRPR